MDSAQLAFIEKMTDSLELGKFADFVIFSDNPKQVAPQKIRYIQVELVVVEGE
ncbi:amidohydrolase family protein [Belliella pelovolcani]|uniref:amidohydrolase family protein n=1 Tax=Belliella pelovolcani TaxID=529505 RepID=UPI003918898E